jgi:hypothetical protein
MYIYIYVYIYTHIPQHASMVPSVVGQQSPAIGKGGREGKGRRNEGREKAHEAKEG